jgi:TrmH family RNA methyltransferase
MPLGDSTTRIDSPANRRIKRYRALATPKGRREHGLFQLEGASLLAEALAAGVPVQHAYWCPERARHGAERELAERLADRTQLSEVSERVLRYMSSTVTPQAVAAEAPIPQTSLDGLELAEACLIVAPVHVQDPGNLGTMVRTAHAVGANVLVTVGRCADPYAPKVVRATMGSLFWVPVVGEPEPARFLTWCETNRVSVVAATVGAGHSLYETRFEPRTAIALGSESQGLAEEFHAPGVREAAIPMPGGAESLNVAVAAGIMVYEYRRQHALPGSAPGDRG